MVKGRFISSLYYLKRLMIAGMNIIATHIVNTIPHIIPSVSQLNIPAITPNTIDPTQEQTTIGTNVLSESFFFSITELLLVYAKI
jgi:hypothetical protein